MRRKAFPKAKQDKRAGSKREAYNVPDELDLKLLQDKITLLCKSLDSEGKAKPLTENGLKAIIRSAVRKKWMASPSKLSFLHKGKVPDLDPNSRTRFKIQCNICQKWFKESEIEIDHLVGHNEFTDLSQLFQWAQSILDVGWGDLQRLCIPCHELKTLAEAQGMSLEDAVIEKEVIAIIKESKGNDKVWLESRYIDPASNAAKRRVQIREHLTQIKLKEGK